MYNINIEKISILEYKEILKNKYLIPSRKILLENIDLNFEKIIKLGINNLAVLKKELDDQSNFSDKTKIPIEYLNILRREIGAIKSKVIKLTDFTGIIDKEIINSLIENKIVNSKQFYEQYSKENNKKELEELYILCSYIRMDGVGVLAAKAFYEAGYRSVNEIAKSNCNDMLIKITNINKENKYFTTKLGTNDIQYCIDSAKLLYKFDNI